MSRFECFGIDIINVVRVEYAWAAAIEDGLFAWRVSETETAPAAYG